MSASSGGAIGLTSAITAAYAYLPALWAVTGISVLLAGAFPKLTALVWGVIGYSFVTMFLGTLLNLPEWTKRLTPYGYIPKLPIDEFAVLPPALLVVFAAVLAAAGVWRFKDRDIIA